MCHPLAVTKPKLKDESWLTKKPQNLSDATQTVTFPQRFGYYRLYCT